MAFEISDAEKKRRRLFAQLTEKGFFPSRPSAAETNMLPFVTLPGATTSADGLITTLRDGRKLVSLPLDRSKIRRVATPKTSPAAEPK